MLRLAPCDLDEANEFVARHHRHHPPVVGHKFSLCALSTAAARAAFSLGYLRIGTYTLPDEGGASLRGAGWKLIGERGGGSWSRDDRPRIDMHPTQGKLLWEREDA